MSDRQKERKVIRESSLKPPPNEGGEVETPRPIDIKTIDMELLERLSSHDPHVIPYAHHRGGVAINPNDMDKSKHRALQSMQEQTDEQLGQIFEQMQLLARQAKKIQDRIEISKMVYMAKYQFNPAIGQDYYLYSLIERLNPETETSYILSLLTPSEVKKSSQFALRYRFIAKVQLLADKTWKVLESGS